MEKNCAKGSEKSRKHFVSRTPEKLIGKVIPVSDRMQHEALSVNDKQQEATVSNIKANESNAKQREAMESNGRHQILSQRYPQ